MANIFPEFNTLTDDVFNARLAQANLITKTDFDAKMSSLNRKVTSNKSKVFCWKWIEKAKSFYSSYRYRYSDRYFERIIGIGNYNYNGNTFISEYLKDCLMKELILLKNLIIFSLQT